MKVTYQIGVNMTGQPAYVEHIRTENQRETPICKTCAGPVPRANTRSKGS